MSKEYRRIVDQEATHESARFDDLVRQFQTLKAELGIMQKSLESLSATAKSRELEDSELRNRIRGLEVDVRTAMQRVFEIHESRTWKALSRSGRLVASALSAFQHPLLALSRFRGRAPSANTPAVADAVVINSDFPASNRETVLHSKTEIRGWAAARTGIARVEARLGSRPLALKYGFRRTDVRASLPDYKDSQDSGFSAVVDPAEFTPGPHELRLVAVSQSGRAGELVCSVIVERRTEYEIWRERHPLDEEALIEMKRRIPLFSYKPLVSVVCPVYNTPEPFLRSCVASVRAQIYPHWELILADDGSRVPEVRTLLAQFAAQDDRIHTFVLPENRGIAAATNEALAQARGEFVGFLDHDDELAPNALYEIVYELNLNRDWDVFYSDEDKIAGDGRHVDAFFKPDWSPDLLLAENYVCHFLVCRRSLIETVGGLREGFDGSQDHDLALRLSERTGRIRRIPKILYHWRIWEGSTASVTDQKPEASRAGLLAIQDYLTRTAPGATAVELFPSVFRVCYPLEGRPEVAIIIPTAGNPLLVQALESVLRSTTYSNYRILVVDNSKAGVDASLRKFRNAVCPPIQLNCRSLPFNFSMLCNRAARSCDSPYFLFLNDDTAIITPDWIEAMLEQAQREEVGAVGALLLFPDGRIQHAGVVLGVSGLAGHSFRLLNARQEHYFHLPSVVRNCSAVTGACMLVASRKFWEVGGFDEERLPMAFQDVDFCLKLHERGYRNIYTPHARLYHHESATKVVVGMQSEMDYMHQRWAKYILDDPYYNPNLTRLGEDYTLPL